MDLRPEEKFLRFSELSENRALKPFAHFCMQPAAPGLKLIFLKLFLNAPLQKPQVGEILHLYEIMSTSKMWLNLLVSKNLEIRRFQGNFFSKKDYLSADIVSWIGRKKICDSNAHKMSTNR